MTRTTIEQIFETIKTNCNHQCDEDCNNDNIKELNSYNNVLKYVYINKITFENLEKFFKNTKFYNMILETSKHQNVFFHILYIHDIPVMIGFKKHCYIKERSFSEPIAYIELNNSYILSKNKIYDCLEEKSDLYDFDINYNYYEKLDTSYLFFRKNDNFFDGFFGMIIQKKALNKNKWLLKKINCSIEKKKEICCIDMEEYEEIVKTLCNHYISIDNLYKWINENQKTSCPYCRTELLK